MTEELTQSLASAETDLKLPVPTMAEVGKYTTSIGDLIGRISSAQSQDELDQMYNDVSLLFRQGNTKDSSVTQFLGEQLIDIWKKRGEELK